MLAPQESQEGHADSSDFAQARVYLHVDRTLIQDVVRKTLDETFSQLDWPAGRFALDEAEAAAACGVGRHVLRDLRLSGKVRASRLGKKFVYTRNDLQTALESSSQK